MNITLDKAGHFARRPSTMSERDAEAIVKPTSLTAREALCASFNGVTDS